MKLPTSIKLSISIKSQIHRVGRRAFHRFFRPFRLILCVDFAEKRAPIDDIFAEAVVNEATLASKDTLTESSSEDEDSVATRASDADYCPDTGGVNADDSDDEPMDADNLPEHSPRTKRRSPKTQAKAKTKLEPQKRKRKQKTIALNTY